VISVSARGLGKTFRVRDSATGEHAALRGFDVDIPAGEFLVVVGPSGCGKTTFLNILAGLDEATEGTLLVDGAPVRGPGLDRGVVFQQYALFPWRTALDNVAFGLQAKGVPKRQRLETAREYLSLVGLAGFADRYPHALSGGMKQRVAIARALAFDPDVLLLDEPFAALDAQTREALQVQLLRIWQQTGKTVVFITHSIDEAVFLGQRVAVMTAGPGRIKDVVDVRLARGGAADEDVRYSPAFGEVRRRVWRLLKAEVARSQFAAGDAVPGAGAGEEEVSHGHHRVGAAR
jgi:NitT/TauT family transport system ATP-binding protein